jgi:hypothetical protein
LNLKVCLIRKDDNFSARVIIDPSVRSRSWSRITSGRFESTTYYKDRRMLPWLSESFWQILIHKLL